MNKYPFINVDIGPGNKPDATVVIESIQPDKRIAVFATPKGFERFKYDMLTSSANIEYVNVYDIQQIRSMELAGWIMHYSALKDLQREVMNNLDLINSRIR